MRIETTKNSAEARLFNLICDAIEPLLAAHSPLLSVKSVGIKHDFDGEDIELRIRLSQSGKVRLVAEISTAKDERYFIQRDTTSGKP